MTLINSEQIFTPIISFNGSCTEFLPPGRVFFTVPLTVITTDTANSWDAANNHFVCPLKGNYLCMSQIRPTDNVPVYSFFNVVSTSNTDMPAGLWTNTLTGASTNRNGNFVGRILNCEVGDRLRLVTFQDTSTSFYNSANMSIFYLC